MENYTAEDFSTSFGIVCLYFISWLLYMQEKNSISGYLKCKYQYKQQRKPQLLPQSRSSIYNSILLNVSPKHILLICICQPVLTMKSRA